MAKRIAEKRWEPSEATFQRLLPWLDQGADSHREQPGDDLVRGDLATCYSDDASGAMLLLDLAGGTLSPSSFVLFGAAAQNLATRL